MEQSVGMIILRVYLFFMTNVAHINVGLIARANAFEVMWYRVRY